MDIKKNEGIEPVNASYLTPANDNKNLGLSAREFDILACLLDNMKAKRIAYSLSISTSTVEVHIRNIITKFGCSSRREIPAFLEKIDSDLSIRKHCLSLSAKIAFEQELKKLANYIHNITCIIIYNKEESSNNNFLLQLEKHLTLAGISTNCKAWSKGKIINYVTSKIKQQTSFFIIYLVDNKFLEKLQQVDGDLIQESNELRDLLKKKEDPVIFIFTSEVSVTNIKNNIQNSSLLNMADHKNYYSLTFALLKILLSTHELNEIEAAFNKQYQQIDTTLPFQPRKQKAEKGLKNHAHSKKMLMSMTAVFLLSVITAVIINNLPHYKKQPPGQTTNTAINNLKHQEKTKIFNLPPRNYTFTGRKEILARLKKTLTQHAFGVITQAITGLGGVGKTQLAVEFAYQTAIDNYYSAIFWIPAETPNAIYNAYNEIAKHLQLGCKDLELENIQTLVHNRLAALYKDTKILLILDNVPNYNSINNYMSKTHRQLSPSLSADILITSRSQYWTEPLLILDTFTKKEAFAFIKKKLPSENSTTINKLSKTLHYFPLALGQATAYIKEHTNIYDYLKLYEHKQKDYLDKFPENKNQYNETLWNTWSITINKLSHTAREIVFTSAYFEPDNIPFKFFNHITMEKRLNAIKELRKYSFITLVNNKTFKIHRLLQEVIKLNLKNNHEYSTKTVNNPDIFKNKDYWLNKAIDSLQQNFNFDYLNQKKWLTWAKLLPHVQQISLHAIESSSVTFQKGLEMYIKYAMHLTYISRDGKQAVNAWNKILSLAKTHYKGQSSKFIVANINSHLSNAQSWAGNYLKAKENLKATIPTYQETLPKLENDERKMLDLLRVVSFKNNGSDHVRVKCDLNFALLILGGIQYYLGDIQNAFVSYNSALEILKTENLDNPGQYYLVDTLLDVGTAYIYTGEFIKAEETLKKANQNINKLYANHTIQALTYSKLAFLNYHLGEFHEAMHILEQCSKLRTLLFPSQHKVHVDTLLKSGFINYMQNKPALAIENLKQAEKINNLYNDDDLLGALINLGLWRIYESLGKYNKAQEYMQTTYTVAKLQFGNNINAGMSFQLTQADLWPKISKNNSKQYWQLALKTSLNIFGPNNYQPARYHYMLGQNLEIENKYREAYNHYHKALEILDLQDIKHPKLTQFYNKNHETLQNKMKELTDKVNLL